MEIPSSSVSGSGPTGGTLPKGERSDAVCCMDFNCKSPKSSNEIKFQYKTKELENALLLLTHATCSFSISRNSDSSSHGESASIQILLPTVGRSDGKNGIIDIASRNLRSAQ